MAIKPLAPRALARRDAEEATRYYRSEAGEVVALAFIDALQLAYRSIAAYPAAGSPRYGHDLDLPGLRSVRLDGYPYLIFYMELPGRIEVWRVLHGQRDIPGALL